jgi:hypothetical protein
MADQPKKVTVKRKTYKDKEYLVTAEGRVYDPDTRETVDELRWDADAQAFIELSKYGLDEDNFEDEEDYNQYLKNLDWEIDEAPEANGFRRIYDDNGEIVSFIKETDIKEDDVIKNINAMGITIENFKINHPYTEPRVSEKSAVKTTVAYRPETVVDITIQVIVGFAPVKEDEKPNVLFYPVFWSGQITAVDVETRDWSGETELDLTEPVGYIGINVGENLDVDDSDLYPRFKEILLGFFDDFDDDYTIQMLQRPAKLYNDIDKTFIQTLGFDLPKMRINNKEQIWDFGKEPAVVAAATPEPVVQEKKAVVTAVVNLPETKEVLQDKLEVHPTFGLVRKITPFRPTGTPKEKKEQTKREMKTLKPILQKLLDEVGDMETELVRLEGIIGGINRRFSEAATEYERSKDKALKAEMYRIKEELKPYEIQFDALEQKFQADRIIASTEELKFDELEKLYTTFKEGKGIDNPDLYKKAKELADATYSKPSAYKSGFIVNKYKELGGTYSGQKGYKGIGRWFKEEWKDVGNKEYPVFRPTKRVTKDTPLTPDEIDPANVKKQIALKQVIKGDANLPAFKIKEGGALKGLDPNKKTDILKFSDPKKAIKNAIQYLKDNIVFGLSTKKTKKYMVQRPDGKWIHFGEMGYEDFTKHQDDKRRQNYLKRTANMKGNWKDDKYSANNLARNILW